MALCAFLMMQTAAMADSGIYGRVAWRGELIPDVVVSAFTDGEAAFLRDPVAVSQPAGTDGTYRLPLPPGQYTLVARSGGSPGRPLQGEYYCYYSGSPVVVSPGHWTPVGFNLVKVGREERTADRDSVIEGLVSYRDEPLEKLYLTLYDSARDDFRGPGIATIPVGSGGKFRIAVKPGPYFVIARKRARGGMYGPMEIGDYFNYYPGNPVEVPAGQKIRIHLETVTRISQLEEGETPTPTVRGTILDEGGSPVGGMRVLVYPPDDLTGRPLYFSEPSDPEGRFSLLVPRTGVFTLVAKERFGGPAGEGEPSGRLEKLSVPGEPGSEVTIVVRKGGPP